LAEIVFLPTAKLVNIKVVVKLFMPQSFPSYSFGIPARVIIPFTLSGHDTIEFIATFGYQICSKCLYLLAAYGFSTHYLMT